MVPGVFSLAAQGGRGAGGVVGFCFGRGIFFSRDASCLDGIGGLFSYFTGNFPNASTDLNDNAVHYHGDYLLNE